MGDKGLVQLDILTSKYPNKQDQKQWHAQQNFVSTTFFNDRPDSAE